jgi:hypothetical protein
MANQIFASNYPRGMQMEQRFQHVFGKIQLAASVGSQFGGPESLNWSNILSGAVYASGSTTSNGTALVTVLSASAGTITATAANRFSVGQAVTFVGLTSALGLLLNGQTVIVVTASTTQFTFANSATGTGTSETGMAVSGQKFLTYGLPTNPIAATVTSLAATAASGGTPAYVTVTAANNYFAGALVTFSGLTTTLGLLLNGVKFTVLWASQTQFAILTALTGSAGADSGTASAQNPCAPSSFIAASSAASGYIYQVDQRNWNIYPMQGGASASLPLAKVTGAYPAGITGDLISWSAYFLKDGN